MSKSPAVIRTLPSKLDIQRELAQRSLHAFIKLMWPIMEPAEPFIDNWHIAAICEHLEAVSRGEIQRLVINVPPGHLKSLAVAVAWQAWEWGPRDNPKLRALYATYENDLTVRDSVRTRDLITSTPYQEMWGDRYALRGDRNQAKHFENTKSGFRMATSVGGAGTGHRVHRYIGDDLLNAINAHSVPAQKSAVDHLRAMSSRAVDPDSYQMVMIGQRLHQNDPTQYALDHWHPEHLCLPTEYDPARRSVTCMWDGDPRTKKGELLFPARFSPKAIVQAKEDLGPYDYAAQHDQLPAPVEGGILKRAWWRDYDYTRPPEFYAIQQHWDTAYTSDLNNDSSACTTWGLAATGMYLLDAQSWHLEMPELVGQVKAMAAKWRATEVCIEAKASGISLAQTVKREAEGTPITLITPVGDKTVRAHAAAPSIAAGNVYVASNHPQSADFFAQTDVFPAGKLRDLADCAVQAVLHVASIYTFTQAQYSYTPVKPTQESARDSFNDPDAGSEAVDNWHGAGTW